MFVFGAPPVRGLGTAGGFSMMIEDRGNNGLEALQAQTDNLIQQGNQTPGLTGLSTVFRANTPQLYVDVDRTKCKTMDVPLSEVFEALQVNLGGFYVNDFNQFGRTWQVNVQADTPFRMQPEDMRRLQVRNARGEMVPLGHGGQRRGLQRAVRHHPLQHVSGRRDQRQHAARRELGRGHPAWWRTSPGSSCPRRWPSSGPN